MDFMDLEALHSVYQALPWELPAFALRVKSPNPHCPGVVAVVMPFGGSTLLPRTVVGLNDIAHPF